MALFNNLNDHGITVVVVTHEHDIAQHARRQLVIRDGLLASDICTAEEELAHAHI